MKGLDEVSQKIYVSTKKGDYMATSVLAKGGNSLALRVPREAANQFKEGDHFDVFADESGLHFKKARKIKRYHISEIIDSFSPEAEQEMDWGNPIGRETW